MKQIMKIMRSLIVTAMLSLCIACASHQTTSEDSSGISGVRLSKETIDTIHNSVFEVVVLKSTKDSLSYERPLPINLIPYTLRKDDYYSLGTAFALNEKEFVSAAHIFDLEIETQYSNPLIRDRNGNVYEIDEIYSYSNQKDFIVFSVPKLPVNKVLPVTENLTFDDRVFAVGNALGEGIIARDGILTSETYEKAKGEWKWLRFSAAVSPGNSGGPLLDKNGQIIGMVTGKSEEANLNYALPMLTLLSSKISSADFQKTLKYELPITPKTKRTTIKHTIELPLQYDELKERLTTRNKNFISDTLKDFLDKNRNTVFPNGKGSLELLHSIYRAIFPNLIIEKNDGNWDGFIPAEIEEGDLSNNGFVQYGDIEEYSFIYLRKPDNIPLFEVYRNPKLMMDLVLKVFPIYRMIVEEEVRITSLGIPEESKNFTDSFGRKWIFNTWPLEYNDTKILTFSLPIPEGVFILLVHDDTSQIMTYYLQNMKLIADFIYLSYYGTFKEWKELFKLREYLPDTFSKVDVLHKPDGSLSFKSKSISSSYDKSIFNFTDDSDLTTYFFYSRAEDKIIWDIGGVTIGEDKNNSNFLYIYKMLKPVQGLKEDFFAEWKNVVNQEYPYNDSPYFSDGRTNVRRLHSKYTEMDASEREMSNFIYVLGVVLEGKIDDNTMVEKLGRINQSTKLLE